MKRKLERYGQLYAEFLSAKGAKRKRLADEAHRLWLAIQKQVSR